MRSAFWHFGSCFLSIVTSPIPSARYYRTKANTTSNGNAHTNIVEEALNQCTLP